MSKSYRSNCDAGLVKNGTLLNHFFTQSVWKSLLENGAHRLLDAILKRYAVGTFDYQHASNDAIVKWIYHFLSKHWRNEYYFRNELMRHYLIDEKPSKDVVALTQLPIGRSRADFVLVNGEGVVYEIKTDRDDLERLDSQISDYYKAFGKVNVVVGDALLAEARGRLKNTNVGLLHLTRDDRIITVKKARRDFSRMDARVMFKILHRTESDLILQEFYGKLPDAPSVDYFKTALRAFEKIPISRLRVAFERRLKARMCNSRVPEMHELTALTYFWNDSCVSERAISFFARRTYRRVFRSSQKRGMLNVAKILSVF